MSEHMLMSVCSPISLYLLYLYIYTHDRVIDEHMLTHAHTRQVIGEFLPVSLIPRSADKGSRYGRPFRTIA